MPDFDIDMTRLAAAAISAALRELLEEKHLYQSVTVSQQSLDEFKTKKAAEAALNAFRQPYGGGGGINPPDIQRRVERECDTSIQKVLEAQWMPPQPVPSIFPQWSEPSISGVPFSLPTIHTFCAFCEKRWPFNPNPQQGFSTSLSQSIFFSPIEKSQVFVLPYQCQSCKGEPLVFMVRREGVKLQLCGRSIIESLPVPKSLAKSVSKFYADAHIAHNAGQTLAGLFLLRTFVEQFWRDLARRGVLVVSDKDSRLYADKLGDAYNDVLPHEFKERFPSLSKIYEEISNSLHNATADGELFAKAANEIVEHFDARRVFKQDAEEERRAQHADGKEKVKTK